MASSIGDAPEDVARRKKSCSWAKGQLCRAFPSVEPERIVSALASLRWHSFEIDTSRDLDRAPNRYHEPATDPCWAERGAALLALVGAACLTPVELLELAQGAGWQRNPTLQTLAALESAGALAYDRESGRWQASANEDHGGAAFPEQRPDSDRARVVCVTADRDGGSNPPAATERPENPTPCKETMTNPPSSPSPEKSSETSATATNGAPKKGSARAAASGLAADAESERARREKISEASKNMHAKRRSQATPAEPAPVPTAESALEAALEPIVSRLVERSLQRALGKLLSGAIGT